MILAKDDPEFGVLRYSEDYLSKLGVSHEKVVVARGTAADGGLARQLADLEASGAAVFIVGSGGGINFACDVARATTLPVLGVPILTGKVGRLDEFLQPFLDMPPCLATFAVGKPGAINAALFAATIISERGSPVWKGLDEMREKQKERVLKMNDPTKV